MYDVTIYIYVFTIYLVYNDVIYSILCEAKHVSRYVLYDYNHSTMLYVKVEKVAILEHH